MERLISRHPSNKGSVVSLDWFNKSIDLFVADARFRTVKSWGIYTDIVGGRNLKTNTNQLINPNGGRDSKNLLLPYGVSDSELQGRFSSFCEDATAKENTDLLIANQEADAAQWCRSQEIEGIGKLDLPNIYELLVIYLEADRLDALDPTVRNYPKFALGTRNLRGRFNLGNSRIVWSSTGCDLYNARCVDDSGYVDYLNKTLIKGVIPVKEL